MFSETQIVFPPFALDAANQRLLRGGEKIFLRSKSLAVLSYLIEHPHRLVTKEELREAVWPGSKVVGAALRVSIQEIRKALRDDSTQPKVIETVGKSGYRFIAPLSLKVAKKLGDESSTLFVGRGVELEQLGEYLALANSGKRQLVFITGEPGIGKSALLDVFTNNLTKTGKVVVARGQCIEQYGAGEAFLPVVDVVEQLCRTASDEETIDLLRRLAPSWLIDIPAVMSPRKRESSARQSLGITPERRLRELTAFFEELAKDRTIIVILEDLHWLDASTLALISFLARRSEPARLMLIGTYRGGEVERGKLSLKSVTAELALHHLCVHLPLKLMSRGAVEEYLAARFENPAVSRSVVSTVYARSEGNPLFMVNVTDYLVNQQAMLREKDSIKLADGGDHESVPSTIRDLITRQFEDFPAADQELLKVASVAGASFSTAALAAGLGVSIEQTERRCDRLVRQERWLQRGTANRWPDGTVATRFGFVHALYQKVVYESVMDARKARLHRSIGERIEAAHRAAAHEVASELAFHFERAGAHGRAIGYLLQAAQESRKRAAYQEAIGHAEAGLRLVKSPPDGTVKQGLELELGINLGSSIAATKGYAAPEAREIFARVAVLSGHMDDAALTFQALIGLWSFYLMRGELRASLAEGQKILDLAERTGKSSYFAHGHLVIGMVLFYMGDFSVAHELLEQAFSSPRLDIPRSSERAYWWNRRVVASCFRVKTSWMLGYPEQDENEAEKALSLARELAIPLHTAQVNASLANHYAARKDTEKALASANAAIEVATEYDFDYWLALGMIVKGWALCKKGQIADGLAIAQEGLTKWRSAGTETGVPCFLGFLAECYEAAKKIEKAQTLIDEALTLSNKIGDRSYLAELIRLKGHLLLRSKNGRADPEALKEAERCFLMAIEIAQGQRAKTYELRAITSLCRLRHTRGKPKEVYSLLKKTYHSFTEGFDSPDLKEAKRLLDDLR